VLITETHVDKHSCFFLFFFVGHFFVAKVSSKSQHCILLDIVSQLYILYYY